MALQWAERAATPNQGQPFQPLISAGRSSAGPVGAPAAGAGVGQACSMLIKSIVSRMCVLVEESGEIAIFVFGARGSIFPRQPSAVEPNTSSLGGERPYRW